MDNRSINILTIRLAVSYLIANIAYTSLSQSMYMVYSQYRLRNVDLVDLVFVYLMCGPGNLFTTALIKRIGLKNSVLVAFAGYAILQTVNLLISLYIDGAGQLNWVQITGIYGINIVISIFNGGASSLLWTVNPMYLTLLSSDTSKIGVLFGLFLAIYLISSIIGPIVTTYVLGQLSNWIYFLCISILGWLSLLIGKFLIKDIPLAEQHQKPQPIVESAKKMLKLLELKMWPLWMFSFFVAFTYCFYPVFINNLIKNSLSPDDNIHQLTGYVFLCLGVALVISGLIVRKEATLLKDKMSFIKIAVVWSQFCFILTCVCYYLNQYYLCFVCVSIWAIGQIHSKTSIDTYIRHYLKGQLQYYGLNLIFFSLGGCFFSILFLTMTNNTYILGSFAILSGIMGLFSGVWMPNKILDNTQDKNIYLESESQQQNRDSMISQ